MIERTGSVLVCAVSLAAMLVAAPSAYGQGGGLVAYENGSPDMGSSYAGANARAQDAATAFQNPAGMPQLEGHQFLVGGFFGLSDFEFDYNESASTAVPPGFFQDAGDLGGLVPGFGSYVAIRVNEDLSLGMAMNVLTGAGFDYHPNWAGRTLVTENQFILANMMPSIGYQVNDWLSLGAGLNIVYGTLDQDFRASSALDAPTIHIDDADDFAFAGTLAVLLHPREGTRIGITYRSEIELDLSGDIQAPLPSDVNFDAEFTYPQGFNVSLYQSLNEQWAILADAGWSEWSAFGSIPTTVGMVDIEQDRHFDDTWRVGVGLEYRFHEDWIARTGFGYDSSPVDSDDVLPDLPVGEQYRFSMGLQHQLTESVLMGLTYTLFYTDISMDGVELPGGVILDGEYDPSFIHFLGINMSVQF